MPFDRKLLKQEGQLFFKSPLNIMKGVNIYLPALDESESTIISTGNLL